MGRIFKWIGIAFWVIFPSSLIAIAFLFFQFNRPPFNLKKLDQVKVGMSANEVYKLLGEPAGSGEGEWVYSRFLAWPAVHIYFDADGKLTGHHYDY